MKFIFMTDSHWGKKNESDFQMQPTYPEYSEELFAALNEVIRKEAVELIVHGGEDRKSVV